MALKLLPVGVAVAVAVWVAVAVAVAVWVAVAVDVAVAVWVTVDVAVWVAVDVGVDVESPPQADTRDTSIIRIPSATTRYLPFIFLSFSFLMAYFRPC